MECTPGHSVLCMTNAQTQGSGSDGKRRIRLGYQMPHFSHAASAREIFPSVIAQARAAEAAGFDAAFVMDHFYQLPNIGAPEEPMLEAYTALGALATATERIQLSTLVTGNTYRNPAMLAKTVTTLDVVSGGRAVLGIGAGWYEFEHIGYGYEFGTFTQRFERLEEALAIIAPMLHGQHPTFEGKWYKTHEALNNPRIRDDLPIMLGGGGEKKTFGMAARYADHLNIICNAEGRDGHHRPPVRRHPRRRRRAGPAPHPGSGCGRHHRQHDRQRPRARRPGARRQGPEPAGPQGLTPAAGPGQSMISARDRRRFADRRQRPSAATSLTASATARKSLRRM